MAVPKWQGELDVFRVPDLLGGGEEHLEGKVEVACNLPPRDISLRSGRV